MIPTHCTSCAKAVITAPCADFRDRWKILIPPDYHKADPARVHPALLGVIRWRPDGRKKGVGIHGPPGAGKTNALALLAFQLHTPFRWVTGGRLRTLYNDSVNLSGEEQISAKRKFHRMKVTPVLIIDDILEVTFTGPWREALFDLLESRNAHNLLTCWTAQHGPDQIGGRIGDTTGEAIERRLIQHHSVFAA